MRTIDGVTQLTIDGFTRLEALDALYFCLGQVNCMQIYLDLDRKNNRDQEYSLWKLEEAQGYLRAAEKRMKAFGLSFLDQKFYSSNK